MAETSTPKSNLITNIEESLNISLDNDIDEYVLRGIWKKNNFASLYEHQSLNNLISVEKAKFEGIIDAYFETPLKLSKQENEPLINSTNNDPIAEPDIIELKVTKPSNNDTIPIPNTNGYPICGNACMDCCEDVCEHAICCNCASVIYDVWDESIAADANNHYSGGTTNFDGVENVKDDAVSGFCYNPCEDCCEDICEHAICCNCTASIVSHWFEAADIDTGNEIINPVAYGMNETDGNTQIMSNKSKSLLLFHQFAMKQIQEQKKVCRRWTLLIVFVMLLIASVFGYFLFIKPKYE